MAGERKKDCCFKEYDMKESRNKTKETRPKKGHSEIEKSLQISKLKSDLKEAFHQVSVMAKSKKKKKTLSEFLNEL